MSPRLFWQVASLEARTRMSYRADFWIGSAVGFLADFGVVFFVWSAMFRESGRTYIGGRDLDATILYYVAAVLVAKIVRGDRYHGTVAGDIYEGHLNRYLVFPASYVVFKYAQRLGVTAPTLLQMALLGGVAFLFLDTRPHVTAAFRGVAARVEWHAPCSYDAP